MRRERTFKKSLLFLAIMSIMIFAMSITASAAATNIKQTEGTKSYVEISWIAATEEQIVIRCTTQQVRMESIQQ